MSVQVRDFMTSKLITAHASESLIEAYNRMKKNGFRHLPVINEEKLIVGIISDRDFQRALKSEVTGTKSLRLEKVSFNPESKVSDYMSWPIMSVSVDTDIKTVAEMMIEDKISAFLVKEGNHLKGIITHEDLLKILVTMLSDKKHNFALTLKSLAYDPAINYLAKAAGDMGI